MVIDWCSGRYGNGIKGVFGCGYIKFVVLHVLELLQNKRKITTFYVPKLLIVGLIWISVVTLASWQSFKALGDPTYNYQLDSANFLVSWWAGYFIVKDCLAGISFFLLALDFKTPIWQASIKLPYGKQSLFWLLDLHLDFYMGLLELTLDSGWVAYLLWPSSHVWALQW